MKKTILALVLIACLLPCSAFSLASGPTEPYLKDLQLQAVDTATIRVSWEGNDPPYTAICDAPYGAGMYLSPSPLYPKTKESITESRTSFGMESFSQTDTWLFPNTEYSITIVSNHGLRLEKQITTKKAAKYSDFGAAVQLYLLPAQCDYYDTIDEDAIQRNPGSYLKKTQHELKMSLEKAQAYGFSFCPWMTLKYKKSSDDHGFTLRLLLRRPDKCVNSLIYTVSPQYDLPAKKGNWTWYMPVSNALDERAQITTIDGEQFTETGKYVFELYFDEYLADAEVLTIY